MSSGDAHAVLAAWDAHLDCADPPHDPLERALADIAMPPDLRAVLAHARLEEQLLRHVPQAARNARTRFHRWVKINPAVTLQARADQVDSLLRLYRLERFGEPVRYYLYRHTFFADASPGALAMFDRLLDVLLRDASKRWTCSSSASPATST